MESRYRISRDRYHGHDPPSFSSTLLDSIYRSFDDSAHERSSRGEARRSREQIVDCWMEFGDRRRSIRPEIASGVYGNSSPEASVRHRSRGSVKVTSSSDSSSFGGFSSSDTDSFYGDKKKNKSLKPIRTSLSDRSETLRPATTQSESFSDDYLYRKSRRSDDKPAKSDGPGGRTAKSRAMKFYGELKRMKQPISPGGKLATFLNSLFSVTGNAKKQGISTSTPATATGDICDDGRWERSESKSNYTTTSAPTCSTASSYSRSCLSKTPSSAGAKRSVRFSPVNVVIEEDIGPRGNKTLHNDENLTTATHRSTDSKNRRVGAAAMELLENYNRKWELSGAKETEMVEEDYHGEGEDAESCCSSDLFELENLLQIGVDRYCAELPVYETTRVDTNRAIASGLIV